MPLNCSNVTVIETGFTGDSSNMFVTPKYKRRKNNFTWKEHEGWVDTRNTVIANTQPTS